MLLGQDWNILNVDQKYNFQTSDTGFIEATIWIDSTKIIECDSIHFLNRIVEDCDTCYPYYNDAPQYAFLSNQFLPKEVYKNDTAYVFEQPEQFMIKYKAKNLESWIFDDSLSISAQVVSIQLGNVFGDADSIKIIALSTNDTIILSQNYGLLRFDSPYEKNRYNLVGIDNVAGKSLPKFQDFFNFSVGDLFEFQGQSSWTESDNIFFIHKIQIVSKYISGDTLKYDIHVKEYQRLYGLPLEYHHWSKYASYREYYDKWVFIDSLKHPTNLYNKQLTYIEDIDDYCDLKLSRIIIKMDSAGLYSKQIGTLNSLDFFAQSETNPELLIRDNMSNCDQLIFSVYKEGLGVVHQEVKGAYGYLIKDLVAYKKGDEIVGDFTEDEDLLVSVSELRNDIINVYPNPAKDLIYIDSNEKVLKATLVNMQGEIVKVFLNTNVLHLLKLKSGFYILRIEAKNIQFNKRIVINGIN